MSCLYFPYYRQAKAVGVTKIGVKKKACRVQQVQCLPQQAFKMSFTFSYRVAPTDNTANLQNNFETASVSTSFYLSPH